jgi:signal transduction histidine kinase
MNGMSQPRILVVDDDAANRYVKVRLLRRQGYEVSEAADGNAAVDLVASERPVLVLLDVRLPGRNGLDVCREVKARWPGTLVLQTSAACTEAKDRVEGLAGGADSYLVEPIEPNDLCAAVASLLGSNRVERELRLLNSELEERAAANARDLAEANRRLALEVEGRTKLEEAMRHAEKLDALGHLTGGVAHDFNNLLTVVIGNLELAESECARLAPPAVARFLKLVGAAHHAAQDCERLTRQLLALARRDVTTLEILDPNTVIAGFESLLARALGERIAFTTALAPDCGPCRIDRGQCEAALLNLAINARDAMPLGGAVRLATRNVEIDTEEALAAFQPLMPQAGLGRYVAIAFTDSGSGMTDQVLTHAFERFFTTKGVGKGSGLGLSQVYGFVKRCGGFIGVETAVNQGTTFSLFLPVAASLDDKNTEEGQLEPLPRGEETILVVEDNELVLEFAVSSITQLGYRVLLAADARAALDIVATGEPIDLLFTDIVLPNRMSGVELAREARRLRPGLRVLVTSGFAAHARGAAFAEREFPLLPKPYRYEDLARRLREMLTGDVV